MGAGASGIARAAVGAAGAGLATVASVGPWPEMEVQNTRARVAVTNLLIFLHCEFITPPLALSTVTVNDPSTACLQ